MKTRFLAPVLALFMAATAAAEEPAQLPDQIGRLAAASGSVVYRPSAGAETVEALINTPLAAGGRVATAPRAHATVDIAAGRFYLDGDTAMAIGTLGPGTTAVALEQGAVILRILPGGAGQVFVIETPRGRFRADQPGYFEIEVGPETVVASALEGGAQFNETTVLAPGLRATMAGAAVPTLDAAVEDDFIRRVAAEVAETGEDKLETPSHVSPQVTGFQELQRHGLWVASEQYGWVWEPMVASDWAPFQDGRWVEIAPWGRTWIDGAPWGFAPAHYGSWAQVNSRWVWVPGNAAQAETGVLDATGQAAPWVALGPEEPRFTAAPMFVTKARAPSQPAEPKVVNVTTVNNTTNVTTVVKEDHEPSWLVIGGQVPTTPPPTPTPTPSGPRNLTGLGATGTPMGSGVAFPGSR
ncbi:DUF6600 domain-containing protein [Dongia sp.]|uniref:DUF6600 domain-containing protein n=1 Tax=Dongia sp. TaxID=1977262 RepID=UPI003750D695